MVSEKPQKVYGRSVIELCWDKILSFQRLQELICSIYGHIRFEQNSFSTWSHTDIVTGELLGSGFKENKVKVFCKRCGKDLE